MTKKSSSHTGKPWKPGDPLRLDKAILPDAAKSPIADKLERADNAIFSHVSNPKQSAKPTNQKSFHRQKKV